ncbi:SUKH-3 domain-containing protein [Catellatospora tritici]|uniref:SUKH-3 domain-containing protein n=1 Tax=Catellatospora tritici TaxID=2851566 RepID=UPI001C2DC9A3|nr:SUKH-3 domain-containing protein [Catellatospora tritici]MBV1853862.1 SUKH-3 domain-containing protein [Catellatospora tritici]
MSVFTRHDAELVAAGLARSYTDPAGRPWRGWVQEFPDAFVVWTTPADDQPPVPGSGAKTLYERATGAEVTFGSIGAEQAHDQWRRQGSTAARRAVDAVARLGRAGGRDTAFTSSVVLHLADGSVHAAVGCKVDRAPAHHRLVAAWLAAQPAGMTVRGQDRHAELIVLSDWLLRTDAIRDAAGLPGLTFEQVRAGLAGARVRLRQVRDGAVDETDLATPCAGCLRAWVEFGLLEPDLLRLTDPLTPDPRLELPGTRFPGLVAAALHAGGWGAFPDAAQRLDLAEAVVDQIAEQTGLAPLAAARQVFAEFGPSLAVSVRGRGVKEWITPYQVGHQGLAGVGAVLADLGHRLGRAVFPIGRDDCGAVLAVDQTGRFFAADQGGEWCYGEGFDVAVTALTLGQAPRRVREDGTLELIGLEGI